MTAFSTTLISVAEGALVAASRESQSRQYNRRLHFYGLE
uniref:Uncharacterized protein n=1 Tax=Neisseria meningitidis alpha275 TaxID=295996 RepID=C6SM42_NEIME|nr:hypothetical protein predicted by Glimmer/Critica [Neisseria meningitidis alpha275]